MFGKIVEVFHLEHLIGSTPEATIFQASFCLVLSNLLQVMSGYMAAGQAGFRSDEVSMEKLFDDVAKELTALVVLFPPATVADWFAGEWSPEEVARRLHAPLLGGARKGRWRKAIEREAEAEGEEGQVLGGSYVGPEAVGRGSQEAGQEVQILRLRTSRCRNRSGAAPSEPRVAIGPDGASPWRGEKMGLTNVFEGQADWSFVAPAPAFSSPPYEGGVRGGSGATGPRIAGDRTDPTPPNPPFVRGDEAGATGPG